MKIPSAKSFYLRSGLFTLLSLLSAVSSYTLYPILVHILSPSDFGNFAVASATLNQVLAILLAINIISIHLVKKYGEAEARQHAQVIQKALLWLFMAMCLIMLALSPFLKILFKIDNISLFIPLSIVLVVNLPLVVWNGYLQGHKELVRIGVFSFGSSLAKLLFASILGIVAGSIGALFGILAGALIGILILQLYPGVKLPSIQTAFKRTSRDELRFLSQIKFYVIQAVFIVGALGILQNYDISLAKALFEPNVAGTYSGISILSNALYYLAFILVWIVLPEINIRDPKINRRILGTTYKLFGLLAIIAIIGELLLGDLILPMILGSDFAHKTDWLLFATLYQLTLVAVTLYAFYLLICHQARAVMLVACVLGLCLAVPVHFASSPLTMIQSLWLSTVAGVVLYNLIMATGKFIRFVKQS
jgi:O-antigen/teichoic acid export membrane protein